MTKVKLFPFCPQTDLPKRSPVTCRAICSFFSGKQHTGPLANHLAQLIQNPLKLFAAQKCHKDKCIKNRAYANLNSSGKYQYSISNYSQTKQNAATLEVSPGLRTPGGEALAPSLSTHVTWNMSLNLRVFMSES